MTLAGANTKEAKDLITKKVKTHYDNAKDKLNKERNKFYEEIKRYKKIASEDVVRQSEAELQKIYEKIVKDMENTHKAKTKDLGK